MENASKALLIAGGVLIAIIIISMFLMMYSRMANIQKEQQEKIEMEQIATFNAEYEAYDKKVMYGTDVITLLNKVAENNKKYSGNLNYKINIVVTVKNNENEITITNEDGSRLLAIDDSEQMIFTCTKMEYSNLGRINNIEIRTKE